MADKIRLYLSFEMYSPKEYVTLLSFGDSGIPITNTVIVLNLEGSGVQASPLHNIDHSP